MKLFVLEREQVVAAPIETVWPFFATPENLQRMTPPSLSFQLITPPPLVMREGALFDYVIRMRGLPLRWTTLITHFEPPHKFIDVQLRGPYDYWHHTHSFESTSDGGTLVRDTVHYRLPLGPLGLIAHALLVKRDLETIFHFRTETISGMFGKHEAARD